MLHSLRFLIRHFHVHRRLLGFLFFSKRQAFIKIAVVLKENELLRRSLITQGKRIRFTEDDRRFYLKMIERNPKIRRFITLARPETITQCWKERLRDQWKQPACSTPPGRPHIAKALRELIIRIKRDNPYWGNLRIAGELQRMGIDVSKETIRRTVQKGRRFGDILPTGEWARFLKSHWDSLFSCDFLTVETMGFRRFYVFFILELKSRRIMQYGITRNPTMRFVRNQLAAFMFKREDGKTHLIHDNSGELRWFDYQSLGITGVATVPFSPNMNAHAERFVASIRHECLDDFIITGERHLRNLLREYIQYYNELRPHQGMGNRILTPASPRLRGEIKSRPVVFGRHVHFYREAM